MLGQDFMLTLYSVLVLAACDARAKPATPSSHTGPELVVARAGTVIEVVRDAKVEAESEGRRLVVYVGASWCEPCEYFLRAVKDDALPERFDSLRFLKFDFDVDEQRLNASGYGGNLIPRFALPDGQGKPSDRIFEGSIKGAEAIDDLVAKLDALLAD